LAYDIEEKEGGFQIPKKRKTESFPLSAFESNRSPRGKGEKETKGTNFEIILFNHIFLKGKRGGKKEALNERKRN